MIKINSNQGTARSAGVLYLLLAITGTYPFYVKNKLFEYGAPRKTVENIAASGSLFVSSIMSELVMAIVWILIALSLYVLFRKVSRNIALVMLSFVLVGGALVSINVIFQIGALIIVKNSSAYLVSFEKEQLNALVMLLVDISRNGVIANYICMGIWMFPFSYLVVKSGYFPKVVSRIWGTLLIAGGLGYIADFLTFFLMPEYYVSLTEFAFGGDLFSMLWLLIKAADFPDDSISK